MHLLLNQYPPDTTMFGVHKVLYIATLYGIFLAVPLLFFIPYTNFKTSEREKEEIFKEELKRKARELVWERAHGIKSEAISVTTT